MRWLISALAYVLLTTAALSQLSGGMMFPGPGTVHSTGGGSFSLTVGTNGGSAATTTTINYGTITWGSGCNAAVVIVYWYNNNLTDVVSSMSVGGSAATQVAGAFIGTNSSGQSIDVWQLNSPSGSSGTISVTYSVAPTFNSNVTAYCLVSAHTTPGTPAINAASCSSTGIVATATVPAGGAAVVGSGSVSGHVISLTNATADAGSPYTGGGTQDVWGHTTATGSVAVTSTAASADLCTLTVVPYGP